MKAIIKSGNRQFIVVEKDTIFVDHLDGKKAGDVLEFDALALIDGRKPNLMLEKLARKSWKSS